MSDEVTENGIIVSANTEDFSRWTWADETSVSAANLVREVLIEDARIQFDIHDGVATALFGTFEFEIMLEYPISKMMDYWLETNCNRDGMIDDYERSASEILLRDLESAAARLRSALG